MNDQQFNAVTALLGIIHDELVATRRQLRALAAASADGPRFARPLAAFANFDWSEIGADVVAEDGQGPTVVAFAGHQWKRRAGTGKYGDAIWYSRPVGAGEDGGAQYARLITFKDYSPVEPVPADVAQQANGVSQAPARPPGDTVEDGEADVDGPAQEQPKQKRARQKEAQAKAKAQREPTDASADDILYTYGDGTLADLENEREIAAFDLYCSQHGNKPPQDRTSLRNWHKAHVAQEEE